MGVRRAKAALFQWVKAPPGEMLQPEATGAVMEVTKWLKPSDNLSTPLHVQKLQMALHAKAKSESGYRFYALYDKIYRTDILAHAYAKCRSNKGAPGVDRQDFDDVEAYGVQRWLKKPTSEDERNGRPRPKIRGEVSRRAHRSRRCYRICICGGLCWRGRNWGWSEALAVASSPMPTTS